MLLLLKQLVPDSTQSLYLLIFFTDYQKHYYHFHVNDEVVWLRRSQTTWPKSLSWYLVDDSILGCVIQVCAYVAITPFKNKSFETPWALFLSI